MVAFPYVIPYRSSTVVPELFDTLITAVKSPDDSPSILNSKPAQGVADALRALEKNEFNSSPFVSNIMVEEKSCVSMSANGQQHNDNFNQTLINALWFVMSTDPFKYDEVVEKYVTWTKVVEYRAFWKDKDKDLDNSSPPRKRGKKRIWTPILCSSSITIF